MSIDAFHSALQSLQGHLEALCTISTSYNTLYTKSPKVISHLESVVNQTFITNYNNSPVDKAKKDPIAGKWFGFNYDHLMGAWNAFECIDYIFRNDPLALPTNFLTWYMQNQEDFADLAVSFYHFLPINKETESFRTEGDATQFFTIIWYLRYWGNFGLMKITDFCTPLNKILAAAGLTVKNPCRQCYTPVPSHHADHLGDAPSPQTRTIPNTPSLFDLIIDSINVGNANLCSSGGIATAIFDKCGCVETARMKVSDEIKSHFRDDPIDWAKKDPIAGKWIGYLYDNWFQVSINLKFILEAVKKEPVWVPESFIEYFLNHESEIEALQADFWKHFPMNPQTYDFDSPTDLGVFFDNVTGMLPAEWGQKGATFANYCEGINNIITGAGQTPKVTDCEKCSKATQGDPSPFCPPSCP